MAHRVPITIRLDSFEGPLDLLLYLIQSHELDISKISIRRITDQYLAYVKLMQELNFDIASEFLVLASTLLLWKSKSLLPADEAPEGVTDDGAGPASQEELIRQLIEHQRFLQAGADLGQLSRLNEDVFTRPNKKPPLEKIWREMEVTQLALCLQDILTRERKRTQVLRKETVSLTDKILEFCDKLEVGKPRALKDLMSLVPSRPEIVVTFLASLELSRLKKMRLHQQKTYEMIYLELLETLRDFNLDLASGFEPEPPKETAIGATL